MSGGDKCSEEKLNQGRDGKWEWHWNFNQGNQENPNKGDVSTEKGKEFPLLDLSTPL